MLRTQNETLAKVERGRRKSDCASMTSRSRRALNTSAFPPPPSAFTLTELLVVITIIAILAGLITGAALGALEKAKQAAVTAELQQVGTAVENFKLEYGAYPPNCFTGTSSNPVQDYAGNQVYDLIRSDIERMFKKAFPRHQEPAGLIRALAGNNTSGAPGNIQTGNSQTNTGTTLPGGLTPAEAVVFWLGGFSKDPQYPISGPGGPSYIAANAELLESRNWADAYEFNLGRTGPRDANSGTFAGRWIQYQDPTTTNNVTRQINLWTYVPEGSELPLVYFDASRHEPAEYDPDLIYDPVADRTNGPVFGLKQLREGFDTSTTPTIADIVFVEKGKFQILHAGTDGFWGDMTAMSIRQASNQNDARNVLVAPTGPFIGDSADTLGNFMPGTLEDKQQ